MHVGQCIILTHSLSVEALLKECESLYAGDIAFHSDKNLAGIYYNNSMCGMV